MEAEEDDAEAPAAAPLPLLDAEPVRSRYDDCFTRPGLMVVAAALAFDDGGEAEPLLPAFLRRYEDCFTRPGVTSAAAGGGGDPDRGSTPPARGCFDHGFEASAARGEGVLGFLCLPGDVPLRARRSATLCGDDGPLVLEGDTAARTEETGAEEDSGAAAVAAAGAGAEGAEASTAGFVVLAKDGLMAEVIPDPVVPAGFVFSARAAARMATRDGEALDAAAARVGEATRVGEAAPLDLVGDDAALAAAAARAEASVVFGRPGRNDAAVGSTRAEAAGAAAAGAGATAATGAGTGAVTAAGAGAAAAACRAPPERASSSALLIPGALALGLRLGASAERSASPGMRPPRSVALASALAEVSSQEMSSSAPACVCFKYF